MKIFNFSTIALFAFSSIFLSVPAHLSAQSSSFVSIKNYKFYANKKPYYFIGANYWYGSLLGLEKDKKRGVERLDAVQGLNTVFDSDRSIWTIIKSITDSLRKN